MNPELAPQAVAAWSNIAAIAVAFITGLFAWLASRSATKKEAAEREAGDGRPAVLAAEDRALLTGALAKLDRLEDLIGDIRSEPKLERLAELLLEMRADFRILTARIGDHGSNIWNPRH